jgi:hypothetical protein
MLADEARDFAFEELAESRAIDSGDSEKASSGTKRGFLSCVAH